MERVLEIPHGAGLIAAVVVACALAASAVLLLAKGATREAAWSATALVVGLAAAAITVPGWDVLLAAAAVSLGLRNAGCQDGPPRVLAVVALTAQLTALLPAFR